MMVADDVITTARAAMVLGFVIQHMAERGCPIRNEHSSKEHLETAN